MTLSYDDFSRVLIDHDPFRWTWRPAPEAPMRRSAVLRRRLGRLRERALAEHAGRAMADLTHRLRAVDPTAQIPMFPAVPGLAGRHPLVLAHGPSLQALLPDVAARRDCLYVVAPLRTALRLAEAQVCPDVVLLADAAAPTADLSIQAWMSASPAVRRRLGEEATLVTQPLPPSAIHRGFRRACVFDDGLEWLPRSAWLPFWGSALLPSLCLPLALGARTVAIAGMDMGATHGRACRTWRGAPMRLDPKLEIAHGLLQIVAETRIARWFDLSPDSILKRGFEASTLEAFVHTPGAVGEVRTTGESVRMADALRHVARAAAGFFGTVAEMSAAAERACELATADPLSTELATILARMEHDWAEDPTCRAALSLLQPPYLRAFWQLRAAGFTSRNPAASVRMKARLIGPEIASLQDAYSRWLVSIQEAADCGIGSPAASRERCA